MKSTFKRWTFGPNGSDEPLWDVRPDRNYGTSDLVLQQQSQHDIEELIEASVRTCRGKLRAAMPFEVKRCRVEDAIWEHLSQVPEFVTEDLMDKFVSLQRIAAILEKTQLTDE